MSVTLKSPLYTHPPVRSSPLSRPPIDIDELDIYSSTVLQTLQSDDIDTTVGEASNDEHDGECLACARSEYTDGSECTVESDRTRGEGEHAHMWNGGGDGVHPLTDPGIWRAPLYTRTTEDGDGDDSDGYDVGGSGGGATHHPHKPPRDILEQKNEVGPRLIIFMVGLPARGKSYICKKLVRYLSWSGFNTRVFNVGNRRRVMALGSTTSSTDKPDSIIKPPPPPPSDISDSTTSTHDIPTITTTHSDSSFVVTPTPQASYKPLSIARLLISKHSPLPTLPVPEPTPSPILHAPAGSTTHDAHFFDPDNPAAKAVREKLAMETLEEIFEWLREGGKVAIHDATNSTRERRRMLLERTRREKGVKGVFIESICTDKDILQNNIEMKLQGPDYKNIPREQAMKDFVARTENYERAYETVGETEEEDLSYIKLINVGRTVVTHNVHGYLESQCVFYLMQMHIDARTIYLTRHGESTYNLSGRIGGDPPLTPHGRKYAAALARFMKSLHPVEENTKRDTLDTTTTTQSIAGQSAIPQSTTTTQGATPQSTPFDRQPSDLVDDNFGGTSRKTGLSVWTSTLLRATQTVEYFPDTHYDTRRIKFLNEIYAGTCEDLTYKEIATLYPDEYQARQSNKLLYRYPGNGGESYVDVIERLRPIIIELERMRSNVLIVTHRVVLRTLLAYFVGVPLEEMTRMEVPLHCLWCLRPKPYGADLVKYKYNAETDWFDEIGTTV